MLLSHKISKLKLYILLTSLALAESLTYAQGITIKGQVFSESGPLEFATVQIRDEVGTVTDSLGHFRFDDIQPGNYLLEVYYLGFLPHQEQISAMPGKDMTLEIYLEQNVGRLDEVVVTGTMKEVSRLESPVPVEVYRPSFFKLNPTPNIYEALQNVNGVRPQLNCNVCNTGDIHINGLEGPYTMVLIDGMPIVSSLATVYGLSGIPNSLIERMEVVKGPASSLYGSEAIGGLINVITKQPGKAPRFSLDLMATSWQEYNTDLGLSVDLGKASVLTGANYYHFDTKFDENDDNFTDVTLQKRTSIFQKWNFERENGRLFTLAGRYYYEDRWGGELEWNENYRGGDEIYGESIYTSRWELLANYELPVKENILLSLSYNDHDQNSVYGDLPYLANQKIAFAQTTWDKSLENHDLLAGVALRYTFYDDNTPATGGPEDSPDNDPDEIWLPGVFIQDEMTLAEDHKMLVGLRYDYNNDHGNIITPRLAYKWSITPTDILRVNAGTGFRVVNLFTEEHAALTGARDVVILESLKPERSYNINLNYIKKFYFANGGYLGMDVSAWHTHFNNIILPDYETNPNQIIYKNLEGYAVTQGASANLDFSWPIGITALAGVTFMDVASINEGERTRPLLTEKFTGTWALSYKTLDQRWSFDYTGNVYSPMLLPVLGPSDPRDDESPWWSIQNIQVTYSGFDKIEIYGGVKNLLNWTPSDDVPFLIARSEDPFDKNVEFNNQGEVVRTDQNPYGLTFDPSYVYAPNQGIRAFLGIRYQLD